MAIHGTGDVATNCRLSFLIVALGQIERVLLARDARSVHHLLLVVGSQRHISFRDPGLFFFGLISLSRLLQVPNISDNQLKGVIVGNARGDVLVVVSKLSQVDHRAVPGHELVVSLEGLQELVEDTLLVALALNDCRVAGDVVGGK